MHRCRRQWLGVALHVYARLRHHSHSTAATAAAAAAAGSSPPQSHSRSASPRRRLLSGSRLLPAPAILPPPSRVLHVSVLSNKRRVSRLAPLRNRARRRITAAVMSVLSDGARGGLDVWIDATLASGLVSADWLRAEAEEAMRAVGALQPHRASERSTSSVSQSTMWRQRLMAAAASRERAGVLLASPANPPPPGRSASALCPVAMQLAITLYSHTSATLPAAALLSRLAHLCELILQPPVSALSRHNSPFLLLQPYTSRHHKHTQRRQLRQCIAAAVTERSRGQSHSTTEAALLGVRQVEECVRWLSEREGEGRQEMAAVLCEARVWLSYMAQSDALTGASNVARAQAAVIQH